MEWDISGRWVQPKREYIQGSKVNCEEDRHGIKRGKRRERWNSKSNICPAKLNPRRRFPGRRSKIHAGRLPHCRHPVVVFNPFAPGVYYITDVYFPHVVFQMQTYSFMKHSFTKHSFTLYQSRDLNLDNFVSGLTSVEKEFFKISHIFTWNPYKH